jgi:arylsulfatase A-like enzyme
MTGGAAGLSVDESTRRCSRHPLDMTRWREAIPSRRRQPLIANRATRREQATRVEEPYSPASRSPPRAAARRIAVVGRPEANAPGTHSLIAELFEANSERINAVFDQTLDLIEDAFEARNTLVVNGAVVDAGPDHYGRLEAGKLFMLIVSSRR